MSKTHLESELEKLKGSVLEMMQLVNSQLAKTRTAFMKFDPEIAQEVIHNEQRVNALELSIDRDCEVILALHTPVATNLRFVISMLKINSDLERIGDYSDGISNYVVDPDNKKIKQDVINAVQLDQMFELASSMTHDIMVAYDKKDTALARKVYKKDKELNQINREVAKTISDYVQKDSSIAKEALFIFSTSRKLERVGDHVKNIAEDLIFYLEAEVLKHKNI